MGIELFERVSPASLWCEMSKWVLSRIMSVGVPGFHHLDPVLHCNHRAILSTIAPASRPHHHSLEHATSSNPGEEMAPADGWRVGSLPVVVENGARADQRGQARQRK